ncbi:MAG: glycosyltransferase, partial [Candidatus Falkowbacteria bacterium]|nr:glycosyltransferase [Candidatus Falkowbacteria bacterium]
MSEDIRNKPRIILSGGGTMGSVTPLLVLAEELKNRYDFIFVGTRHGVERGIVTKLDYLKYKPLISGKWRRYFSLYNFLDLFKVKIAFWQSLWFLRKVRPALVISAGAYVSVPLAWAAYFLKIPVLIHQQDIRPGFANRLMAKTAKIITVTFKKSLADYGAKAVWVGNPYKDLKRENSERIVAAFRLKENLPLVLALGGG